jgi:hypothetical protein
MLTAGANGSVFTVSYVRHELRHDIECTLFSIGIPVTDAKTKSVVVLKTGKPLRQYVQVTVWQNMNLKAGDKVKFLTVNNFKPFQQKNKAGYNQIYFSFSAEVEVIKRDT